MSFLWEEKKYVLEVVSEVGILRRLVFVFVFSVFLPFPFLLFYSKKVAWSGACLHVGGYGVAVSIVKRFLRLGAAGSVPAIVAICLKKKNERAALFVEENCREYVLVG